MRFRISLWGLVVVLVAATLVFFMGAWRLGAAISNQKTIVTFSGPFEIPGKSLEAGTYVFKVLDSAGTRNIVQVLNRDETHAYATFISIPIQIMRRPEKPIVRFKETAPGAPPAIEAWIYQGRTIGHEFVYPRAHAAELAKANNQNVASMPDDLAADTTALSDSAKPPSQKDATNRTVMEMEQAKVDRVTPANREVAMTKVTIISMSPQTGESEMMTDDSHTP